MLANDLLSQAFVDHREVDIWWLWLARTPSTPRAWLPGLVSAWDSENTLWQRAIWWRAIWKRAIYELWDIWSEWLGNNTTKKHALRKCFENMITLIKYVQVPAKELAARHVDSSDELNFVLPWRWHLIIKWLTSEHTWYLSFFLHNRNLRPGNFTLKSA